MSDETPFLHASSDLIRQTSLAPPPPPDITIVGADGPLVTIHPDGTLDYGPDYTPDEAARRFWDAMRHYMPARCPHCERVRAYCAPEQNTDSLGYLRRSQDVLELIDREERP